MNQINGRRQPADRAPGAEGLLVHHGTVLSHPPERREKRRAAKKHNESCVEVRFAAKTLNTKSVSRAKTPADVLPVCLAHNLRIGNETHRHRKPIDASRTHLNEVLRGSSSPCVAGAVAASIFEELGIQPSRHDAIMAVEIVIQPRVGWDRAEFWECCLQYLGRHYQHIVSAVVHRDQDAPHMHVLALAVADGRLAGSSLTGGHRRLAIQRREFMSFMLAAFDIPLESAGEIRELDNVTVQDRCRTGPFGHATREEPIVHIGDLKGLRHPLVPLRFRTTLLRTAKAVSLLAGGTRREAPPSGSTITSGPLLAPMAVTGMPSPAALGAHGWTAPAMRLSASCSRAVGQTLAQTKDLRCRTTTEEPQQSGPQQQPQHLLVRFPVCFYRDPGSICCIAVRPSQAPSSSGLRTLEKPARDGSLKRSDVLSARVRRACRSWLISPLQPLERLRNDRDFHGVRCVLRPEPRAGPAPSRFQRIGRSAPARDPSDRPQWAARIALAHLVPPQWFAYRRMAIGLGVRLLGST